MKAEGLLVLALLNYIRPCPENKAQVSEKPENNFMILRTRTFNGKIFKFCSFALELGELVYYTRIGNLINRVDSIYSSVHRFLGIIPIVVYGMLHINSFAHLCICLYDCVFAGRHKSY